jgi:uncharacterized protein YqgC (DUF456 family)
MDFLIIIIVIIILLIGIIGCIIPALPGPPISFLGILILHFFSSYTIDTETLWLLAAIVTIITFLDYWLQVYGVKKFGGGKKAINGTILGLVLGLLLPIPFGVIIGPFVGAFLGAKMEAKEDTSRAIKIAIGALVGFLGGTVLKFAVSIYISILFINVILPERVWSEFLKLFS